MKRCPECRRDYYDDTLAFCLEDGTALLQGSVPSPDEPQTAILHETAAPGEAPTRAQIHTTEQTAIFPRGAEAEPQGSLGGLTEKRSFSANKAAKPLAALIAAVLILGGGFLGYRYLGPFGSTQIESIAVMPFVNESGNADVEYLSDGMTETLIGSLSQIPNLSVKARSTVFYYKGKEVTPKKIGEELGVQAVLLGRVSQRGEDVKLSLELVSSQTQDVIWSGQYNRKQADLVSLQSDIARDVLSKLKNRLSGTDEQRVAKTYTANSEAYQLYLKGRYYWNKRTAENIRKAVEQFQKAADIDPNYALAYAGLADCYVVLGDYAGTPESETVPRMQAYARRALELDHSLAEAHTSLAYSYVQAWEWAKGEQEFKRAIELNPQYPTAHHWYHLCLVEMGRFDEAMAEIKLAQQLDPLSPIISFNVATVHLYALGDTESAIRESKKVIELAPEFGRGYGSLGIAYLKAKRYPEALDAIRKAVELSPSDRQLIRDLGYAYAIAGKRVEAMSILTTLENKFERGEAFGADVAAVYAGLNDNDRAFAWIEKDFQARSGRLGRVFYQVPFEALRSDPRYEDLRRRMGVPDRQ
jgi:TolB-like protein/Tfp pilus assembly protein PilF